MAFFHFIVYVFYHFPTNSKKDRNLHNPSFTFTQKTKKYNQIEQVSIFLPLFDQDQVIRGQLLLITKHKQLHFLHARILDP
jgi:hypothetical protein